MIEGDLVASGVDPHRPDAGREDGDGSSRRPAKLVIARADRRSSRPAASSSFTATSRRMAPSSRSPATNACSIADARGCSSAKRTRCTPSSRPIVDGDVVVIRYEGPKGGPGMREMLGVTGAIVGQGLGETVALVTDGRFSGRTRGLDGRSPRTRGVRRRPDRRGARRRHHFDRHRGAPDRPRLPPTKSRAPGRRGQQPKPRYTSGVMAKYAASVRRLPTARSSVPVYKALTCNLACSECGGPPRRCDVLSRRCDGLLAFDLRSPPSEAPVSRASRDRRSLQRSARSQRRLALPRTAAAPPARSDRHAA